MTLKQALGHARRFLAENNIEDSLLESEILLRHTLKISRVQLYLDRDRELSPKQEKGLRHLIKRRLSGEPTAYITGHRQFYGLDFYVNHHVLIPRPESELLVEQALKLAQNDNLSTIADIGTGCGAIAISLALNLPQLRIYATDISTPALEVARLNCQKHGVADRICLLEGDMLTPLPEPVDLIVANLPYVREAELAKVNSAGFESSLALNGGRDGLAKIRRLCQQVRGKTGITTYLILEIGQGQAAAVTSLLRRLFPDGKIEVMPDLGGVERVVSLQLEKNTRLLLNYSLGLVSVSRAIDRRKVL